MNRKLVSIFLLSVSSAGFLTSSSFLTWEIFIKKTSEKEQISNDLVISEDSEEWSKINNSPTSFLNEYDLKNFLPSVLNKNSLETIVVDVENFEYLYLKEFFDKFDIPKTDVEISFDYLDSNLVRVTINYKVDNQEYSVTKEYSFKMKE